MFKFLTCNLLLWRQLRVSLHLSQEPADVLLFAGTLHPLDWLYLSPLHKHFMIEQANILRAKILLLNAFKTFMKLWRIAKLFQVVFKATAGFISPVQSVLIKQAETVDQSIVILGSKREEIINTTVTFHPAVPFSPVYQCVSFHISRSRTISRIIQSASLKVPLFQNFISPIVLSTLYELGRVGEVGMWMINGWRWSEGAGLL